MVPGHVEVDGNEIAGKVAKVETKKGNIERDMLTSIIHSRRKAKEETVAA